MVSEECKTLYNKLNTFVKKVINRDVQPQIDDLESDVNSLNNSILNLVQIQYIEVTTSSTLNANGGTGTATVTVTPLPTGYRYIIVERKGANGRIYNDTLNGNKLTLTAQNLVAKATKVYMRCYLIYVPTSWSYVERIS